LAIACSFFSLGVVIDALLITRILVQFIGQIIAVQLLRKNRPEMNRPFRIWLYPLPSLLALLGWTFAFLTANAKLIQYGLVVLVLGLVCFYVWSALHKQWPFAPAPK
jgi:amino acid transporter